MSSFRNIHFYVNNQNVGPTNIIGAQPELGFFEDLRQHLKGECLVTFFVGNQRVVNKVILKQTEFRVENNFIPFGIESYIETEKARVRQEQERAKFTDELTDVFFVPSQTLLNSGRTFPHFSRTQLAKDPQGSRFFVSHPWLSKEHPDPKGKHLALLRQHAKQLDRNQDAFYWIDYSCLPQNPRSAQDEEFFNRTLPKIASIQSKSSTIVIGEGNYSRRMWCYLEHFTGVLFSQIHFEGLSGVDYLGTHVPDDSMVDKVQILEEPPWDDLQVTSSSDIPGIKYNYKWLSNLSSFQLYDRFSELRRAMPGHEIYSGRHYFQSAFGLQYRDSAEAVRGLFLEFGGDSQYFYKENSLLWLAQRFSWSIFPDDYEIEKFRFCQHLFFSADMVGWIALLLGIIKTVNQGNSKMVNLRELYAQIVLMSLFR